MAVYTVGGSGSGADYIATTSNAQVQINQALAAAKANPGSQVYLKGPFTYDIQGALSIGNDTELTGDATAKLRLHDGMSWASQVHIIKQSNTIAKNIHIHGFEIDCNRWNQSQPEGEGYYNAIGLRGDDDSFGANIHVHHMYIHDSLGDGVRLQYINTISIHDNTINVMGHEGVFCIEVVGGEICYNTNIQKCNSAFRTDNSQNITIHHNTVMRSYVTGANGNSAIQIGNQPASNGLTLHTQNIKIFENTITGGAGSGIMLMDASGGMAGTTPQTVHIFNNTLTGCGWMTNIKYNAGISVWNWGNGAIIEYNKIDGSYNAGILIYASSVSGCTIQVNNNDITNTVKTLATNPDRMLPVSGYGILNLIPSKMAVRLENNYTANNQSGNYYQVTPIKEATSPNGSYDSGSSSGGTVTPPTRYIPPIRVIQDDVPNYYDPNVPKQGYVNGVKFTWLAISTDVDKSIGQRKPPGTDGENLTDFGFKSGQIVIDCYAFSMDEMFEAVAAFYDTTRGRVVIELGGPYPNMRITGITINHSSKLRIVDEVEDGAHPFSVLFQMDTPFIESNVRRVRGCLVTGSTRWSAANTFAGNILKNPSFETWLKDQEVTWKLGSLAYNNEWRCAKHSRELGQFCAISANSADTAGTKIIISSDGETWAVPAGLSNAANRDNNWRGLAWGSSIGLSGGVPLPGRWIATAISGTNRVIYSDDGITWYQGGTIPGNAWGSICYIRDDDAGIYRYVAVSYGNGETNRVAYSDDGGLTWTSVASANESNLWLSVAYSEPLKRLVAVAYSGGTVRAMYSNNYGATWTLGTHTATGQAWTNVIWAEHVGLFVAVAQGGTDQIMTSPDGITWTFRTTPICGSVVVPGTGAAVSTNSYTTPEGNTYTTSKLAYTLEAVQNVDILSIAALTNGHKWRLDKIGCKLRTAAAGTTAWIKITAQTATVAETTLAEWSSVNTGFDLHSKDLTFESAANEAVTIRCYMKSTKTTVKAVAMDINYTLTEWNGSGGSTITYLRNEWRCLAENPEHGVIVAIAQTGTGNRAMKSTDAITWTLCDTPADNNWYTACYASPLNKFVVLGGSGTGNRVMTSDSFGSLKAPANWEVEGTGQSRSSEAVHEGTYALKITGDGVTADIGMTKQYTTFEPGASYIFSAWGKALGLTRGKYIVDLFSGGAIISQLVWNVDCDYVQLQDTVRFDTSPTDAYFRVHSADTPNQGSYFYCDEVLLEKASDFESAEVGQELITLGTNDVIPDVEIRAVSGGSGSSNITQGETKQYISPNTYIEARTSYYAQFTAYIPAPTDGKFIRLDQFSLLLATSNVSGLTAYAKVTVQAPGINGGAETTIANWTSTARLNNYEPKVVNTELYADPNTQVNFKVYLRISGTSGKAYADDISFKWTEMVPSITSSAIAIYNAADTLTVMNCCNELKVNCAIALLANGTGSFKLSENFADTSYEYAIEDSSGLTYSEADKSLLFASTGYMSYRFDVTHPVTGIPYIVLNVMEGAPLIYIAEDNNGSPGTWQAIDGNDTADLSNTQAYRLMNAGTTLVLNGHTVFHLKIASGGSKPLHINSIFMYADLVTMDVLRPKLFKGMNNTFGAQVASTASAVINLYYRDRRLLA